MKPTGTGIVWWGRVWFAVEVFFGVGAVLTIALDPGNTLHNFAWNIQPTVMASVLGAYYISSALLFLLPLFARRWEMIRVMILLWHLMWQHLNYFITIVTYSKLKKNLFQTTR